MGLFAAVNLFLFGFFLLMETIREPLAASATVIVGAAFLLALAAFLFVYLAWPRFKAVFAMHTGRERRKAYREALTVYRDKGALQTEIEAEQALTLDTQFPTDLSTLRRARGRTGSVPPAECDDAARVRQ